MMRDIATTLAALERPGSFAVRRSVDTADLHLEVRGVGPVTLPVAPAVARKLCTVAQPARYGLRQQTLLDRQVRDTWEVARSRVRIDARRWNRRLQPELERIRRALGLPDGCELRAELHNLLIYEPGQFFTAHQDTEKHAGMIGSLVVTLPSRFKGGRMVVEHGGERLVSRGSASRLSLVAFYADCHHAVHPVKEGYRVALTYNLVLTGVGRVEPPPRVLTSLEKQLREFFETPLPPGWGSEEPRPPPKRLVYLLDHQYTRQSLGWGGLKEADALRAGTLREAARRIDCEIFLALADVHELWSCGHEGYGYRADFYDPEDDDTDTHGIEVYGDLEAAAAPGDHPPLEELIDDDVELRHFVGDCEPLPDASSRVTSEELCWTTPSAALDPFEAEYEPYMGNYGDTVDRWYHRAAVVLWPRERGFVIRAEASPSWAVDAIRQAMRSGARDEARRMAAEVEPFWGSSVASGRSASLFRDTLRVAARLDDPDLAAMLLEPFTLELLSVRSAGRFMDLCDHYGAAWSRSCLEDWAADRRDDGRLAWLRSLPKLVQAMCVRGDRGRVLARWLTAEQWQAVELAARQAVRNLPPRHRSGALAHLQRPMLALLESAHVADPVLAAEMRDALLDPAVHGSILDLTSLLRMAHRVYAGESLHGLALDPIASYCRDELKALLARPPRAADDWSIPLPAGCACELCHELGEFLERPAKTRLEWPLKKDRRAHVHQTIDRHELPVSHTTRRTGRPYTLVLEKTGTLFRRDTEQRAAWQKELDWMRGQKILG